MASMGIDKRKHDRRNLGLAATITWPRPMPCVVADISQTGARLKTDYMKYLPDEFDLSLNENLMRKCRVVWRTKTQAGVRFVAHPKFKPVFAS